MSYKAREHDADFYRMSKMEAAFIILTLFAAGVYIFRVSAGRFFYRQDPVKAVIYQDSKLIEQCRLDKNRNFELLGNRMQIEIRNNRIRVVRSNCPQHICMNMGWAQYSGQNIVCVPNKVIIELKSTAEPLLDTVAN
jgi:hypothetical protein